MAPPRIPLEKLFWRRVERGEPDACWLWRGSRRNDGYGQVMSLGKGYGAHRLSYQLNVGPIPTKMLVCHRCDTPLCVNPAHLWVGTWSDNMQDKKRKRRATRLPGESNPASKLTVAAVRAIRESSKGGRELAVEFNTSYSNIRLVKTRKSWAHVT